MKLISSISLSILFMFQSVMSKVDMGCEFQKITLIYLHYKEHKAFDGDSFLDFLIEDYTNNNRIANEHHEVPYHSSHQCSYLTFFFTQQSKDALEIFNYKENLKIYYYSAFFSSTNLDTLLEPPRV
jgi:hypothetical protein